MYFTVRMMYATTLWITAKRTYRISALRSYLCETQNVYNSATEWAVWHKFGVVFISAITEFCICLWENYNKSKYKCKKLISLNMVLETKSWAYTSKTPKIILNLVHVVYYAYSIIYEYHDTIVLNLHASNTNAKNDDLSGALKMRFWLSTTLLVVLRTFLPNWAESAKQNDSRSRNSMPWSPSWNSLWRHNSAVGVPI